MTTLTSLIEHEPQAAGKHGADVDAIVASAVAAASAATAGGSASGGAWWKAPSPPNMPSALAAGEVTISDAEREKMNARRKAYGGKNDLPHLGGFVANDTSGQSTPLWNWMQKELVVRSLVDVGCGRGISTRWFLDHGGDVLCVEGSHDAVEQSLLPPQLIVEHDFSRGPWWPNKTYDVAWSVEFLEHVGRHFSKNYMPIFRRSALAFVTHSTWGGWHHVEVHNEPVKTFSHGARFTHWGLSVTG